LEVLKLEGIKIRLEFSADIDVIKQVLKERGLEISISNMKKVANVYKERQYSIKDKNFFDDFPKDKEILLMYGFKPKK
jgi:pyruvate kinase